MTYETIIPSLNPIDSALYLFLKICQNMNPIRWKIILSPGQTLQGFFLKTNLSPTPHMHLQLLCFSHVCFAKQNPLDAAMMTMFSNFCQRDVIFELVLIR